VLFNSFNFGFFLVVVYTLYWSIGVTNRKAQNILLLLASYVFYGLWDWRFLFLLLASSLIDYYAAIGIQTSKKVGYQKLFLWSSVCWNLGVLFIFKYYNFFIESFTSLFSISNPTEGFGIWNIILPVGLSFYTFQTLSYTIDVYKKTIKASTNLPEFLCFVSFFPQLVAGPIERAGKLLPQFQRERSFSLHNSKDGLRRILWGLFKKVVIADNVAHAVNFIYAAPEDYGSLALIYASILFFFQIYCDFSGYSDIAIGTAKLFGFNLSENFKTPYLSKSITEFWSRWHITLTKWFTDYVYKPLAYANKSKKVTSTSGFWSLLLTMTLIGLWHGASWTFIVFGVFNGIIIVIERIRFNKKGQSVLKLLLKAPRIISSIYIGIVLIISAILFRSSSFEDFLLIGKRILSFYPDESFDFEIGYKIILIPILIIVELYSRFKTYPLFELEKYMSRPVRWLLYYALIIIIFRYSGVKEAFMYFQF